MLGRQASLVVRPVFVGRGPELALMRSVARGTGRNLVVLGGAGMGKSRLVEEAPESDDVTRWAVGTCLPLSVDLPYLPIASAMCEVLGEEPASHPAVADAPPFVGVELARVVPALGGPGPGDGNRLQLFEALRWMLLRVGATLVVEDLHWSDLATLDLLEFLMTRPHGSPVILTARPLPELSPRIRVWLDRMLRLPSTQRVLLDPLGPDAVRTMLSDLGWVGEDAEARSLVARSQGVPFFVIQLAAGGGTSGTDSLSELLLARCVGLDPATLDVLQVLCTAGRPVSDDEITAACADRAGVSLRRLEGRGLIVRAGSVGGRQRFAPVHALLAEAVCTDLTHPELKVLHRRIAECFAAQPDVDADDVARHLAHAGERGLEVSFRVKAAASARRRSAPREALAHLLRVLEIDPGAEVVTFLEAYGLARHAGDTATAARLSEEMLRRFEATASQEDRLRLWHAAGHHRVMRGAAGLDCLERAVSIGRDLPVSPAYGFALYDLARHLRRRGLHARSLALGAELESVARSCRDPALSALVETELVCHELLTGRTAAAMDRLDRARALPEPGAGQGLTAAAMTTWLLCVTGRLDDAVEHGTRIVDQREAAGLATASTTLSIRSDVATALLEKGRLADAVTALGDPIVGVPDAESAATEDVRAAALIAAGRPEAARRYWRDKGELMDYPSLVSDTGPLVLESLIASGELHEAARQGRRMLDTLLACDEARFAGPAIILVRRALADLAESDADRAHARQESRELDEAIAAAPVDPFEERVFPCVSRACGLTDSAERRRVEGDDTVPAWEEAADDWRDLGRPWREAYCALRAGQSALARPGSRRLATPLLARAWSHAEGHTPLRTQIENLVRLARLSLPEAVENGVSTQSNERRSPLTPREQMVLELVAGGHTNAEIGRELYMSASTAGVHVSSILRKLGARTRVEAATKAQRQGLVP